LTLKEKTCQANRPATYRGNVGSNNNATMTTDELKNSIHEFLRYDRVFDLVLRKNPSLFADKLTSVDYKNYWFEYRANDIEIINR